MLHYAERPESFISDTINAGIYCFSKSVLAATVKRTPSKNDLFAFYGETETSGSSLSMERDVLPHLVEQQQVYSYFYSDFWRSVKMPGSALYCNEQYLKYYGKIKPEWYAKGPQFVGNVIVDPSAKIDPTAKIGPNVYVGPKTVIGAGVRVHNSIVSNECVLKDRSCVLWSIVGPQCIVGLWSRIEGLPTATAPTGPNMKQTLNITVLGSGVTVAPEIVVRNCIVMPHKELSAPQFNEILL
jgi:mannose-1-phosphate guanylyltransferase